MHATEHPGRSTRTELPKSPTGIRGLDEVTGGGLPQGRTTLIVGKAGSGKTLLGMEFLVHGAEEYGEPGVIISFEESAADLVQNVASLGYDVQDLCDRGLFAIDHVEISRSDIIETGEFDLEALFIRLAYAIDSIGAKRVVLDTIESLFSGLANTGILRAELRRLFFWLKEKGVTAVVTGESGEATMTRHGLEEYVSDCVILLDHRVDEQISTRRLRVVKYRGSVHGTNEYPFLIDETGISVLPITSTGLVHTVSQERISSGVERLDAMFEGEGFYRGSTVMITGTPGTGKTSFGASFAHAACLRGEKCLYFSFEESPDQIVRNMQSIGIDLAPHIASGLLAIHSSRPTMYGLEMHLVLMLKMIQELQPAVVVIDPLTDLITIGTQKDVKVMLTRLIDYLKSNGITALFTHLVHIQEAAAPANPVVSSLIDTLIRLQDVESAGERNRGLYVLKSRGMEHSNQIREYRITGGGIELADVYVGPAGMFMGTARFVQEAQERAEEAARREEIAFRKRELERKRSAMEARLAALQGEFAAEEENLRRLIQAESRREKGRDASVREIEKMRRADAAAPREEE
ncbi:circadian clock protein KaiC [Methanoculleus sp. FWC-SCC1]|uniref:non-specific serine/threonine protein kinase n=1 Tax=Methanoculleus frigidifontis TaxID=2584085 RepID=A0ABT8M975_9EURY|nr:circadian clock protein KaiC [Methanoculleus sp. FWC-SCC1]MDN7024486.1 circadian clock protein KaiC [Methanoculleus sp. FWC-SCC1]